MDGTKRVLFVNSEIFPYMPESNISLCGRFLPQGIQEGGKEIRAFMPRYGCINERRNQLHEVIRLSGMNIVVGNVDRPLVIKVSSISSARMQVYFIDNEDYFHRKSIYRDAEGKFMEDNDERAIFFARGVLETVKKLRWKPDIVHCQGWMSHFLPVYLKKVYNDDPIFADTKVVISLHNDCQEDRFSDKVISKLITGNLKKGDVSILAEPNGINLAKLAIQYADGVIQASPVIDPSLEQYIAQKGTAKLQYVPISKEDTAYIREYNAFYDKILNIQ